MFVFKEERIRSTREERPNWAHVSSLQFVLSSLSVFFPIHSLRRLRYLDYELFEIQHHLDRSTVAVASLIYDLIQFYTKNNCSA
jgi:hypothetical protein